MSVYSDTSLIMSKRWTREVARSLHRSMFVGLLWRMTLKTTAFTLILACLFALPALADDPVHPLDGGPPLPVTVSWFSGLVGWVDVVVTPNPGEGHAEFRDRVADEVEYFLGLYPIITGW